MSVSELLMQSPECQRATSRPCPIIVLAGTEGVFHLIEGKAPRLMVVESSKMIMDGKDVALQRPIDVALAQESPERVECAVSLFLPAFAVIRSHW